MIRPIENVIRHPSERRQACVENVIRQLPRELRPAGFGKRRYPTPDSAPVLPPIRKNGVLRAW